MFYGRCWLVVAGWVWVTGIGVVNAPSAFADEGSAFVGRVPTAEERAFRVEQESTARLYAACLEQAKASALLSAPDYRGCDGERQAYELHLAKEISAEAVGCLEEGVLGAPREAAQTCAALRARFPFVISRFNNAEVQR